MTSLQRCLYLGLVMRRLPSALLSNPGWKLKLTYRRALFSATRKFCGSTMTSPVTGEKIYNIQTLVNGFAMQVIGEIDGPWMEHLRETRRPVVFDIGSNVGQFSTLALSCNPGCRIFSWDADPDMASYAPPGIHRAVALGEKFGEVVLQSANAGWTASTHPSTYSYSGVKRIVPMTTLDDEWKANGSPVVDVLKIDVDGAEFEVLQGGMETCERTRWLVVETNDLHRLSELLPNFEWKTVNQFDWQGRNTSL